MLYAILIVFTTTVGCDNSKSNDSENTSVASIKENNPIVTAYVDFIQKDENKMTLDHEFTNEALLKLTAAVKAVAGEVDFDINGDLEKARECANNITQRPFQTSHADEIRKAADVLSRIMQNIQLAKYPALATETEELKSAATEINPDVLALEQSGAIKSFFAKSASLLRKMN